MAVLTPAPLVLFAQQPQTPQPVRIDRIVSQHIYDQIPRADVQVAWFSDERYWLGRVAQDYASEAVRHFKQAMDNTRRQLRSAGMAPERMDARTHLGFVVRSMRMAESLERMQTLVPERDREFAERILPLLTWEQQTLGILASQRAGGSRTTPLEPGFTGFTPLLVEIRRATEQLSPALRKAVEGLVSEIPATLQTGQNFDALIGRLRATSGTLNRALYDVGYVVSWDMQTVQSGRIPLLQATTYALDRSTAETYLLDGVPMTVVGGRLLGQDSGTSSIKEFVPMGFEATPDRQANERHVIVRVEAVTNQFADELIALRNATGIEAERLRQQQWLQTPLVPQIIRDSFDQPGRRFSDQEIRSVFMDKVTKHGVLHHWFGLRGYRAAPASARFGLPDLEWAAVTQQGSVDWFTDELAAYTGELAISTIPYWDLADHATALLRPRSSVMRAFVADQVFRRMATLTNFQRPNVAAQWSVGEAISLIEGMRTRRITDDQIRGAARRFYEDTFVDAKGQRAVLIVDLKRT
jgi:hypothetical protein